MKFITLTILPLLFGISGVVHADDPEGACDKIDQQESRSKCLSGYSETFSAQLKQNFAGLVQDVDDIIQNAKRTGNSDDVDEMTNIKDDLVAAQKAWEAYREAECNFYGEDTADESIQAEAIARCQIKFAKQRMAEIINDDHIIEQAD